MNSYKCTSHRTSKEGKSTYNSKIVLCRNLHLCWALKIGRFWYPENKEYGNIICSWKSVGKILRCLNADSYLVYLRYEGGERWKWKDRLETYHKIVKCHDRGLRGCFGQGGSMKSEKVKVKLLSHVRLFVTPWTVAHQAPPTMGFSRQEYWSGLPFPSPGDLPNPGIEPRSPTLYADAILSHQGSLRIYSRILTQMFCKLYKNGVGGSNLKLQRQVREVWNYSGKQLREYKLGQWQWAEKGGNWCWEKPGMLVEVKEKTEEKVKLKI